MGERTIIKTPQLGESITEGTVLLVSKKVGDFVEKGGILFELETEKVTVEVPSTIDGIIEQIFVKVGQVVKVGSEMAAISESSVKPPVTEVKKQEVKTAVPVSDNSGTEKKIDHVMNISPSAHKIAIENSVNLANIKGSGAKGHILKEDVLFANYKVEISGEDEVVDFSEARKNVIKKAQNYQYSAITSFVLERINVTKVAACQEAEYSVIFAKAVAVALTKYPALNALIFDDKVVFKKSINIALQASENLRVIEDCANKSAVEILHSKNDSADSTISICYVPNALMVAPTIVENQAIAITICRTEHSSCGGIAFANVCASFDNRIANAIDVASFLSEVKNLIENTHLMLFI